MLETSKTVKNYVSDLVNRDISTKRGVAQTCTIGLSINENLKLKKRKGKDKQ